MKIEKKKMQAFVDAVEALAPECRVWIKNDGLETRAVDTANVAMVSAKLPKEGFEPGNNPDEGKRFCPLNTKCRGDDQFSLFDDSDRGKCKLDNQECHYPKCETFNHVRAASGCEGDGKEGV